MIVITDSNDGPSPRGCPIVKTPDGNLWSMVIEDDTDILTAHSSSDNGETWTREVAYSPGAGMMEQMSAVSDSSGRLHVVFRGPNITQLNYMQRNAAGVWSGPELVDFIALGGFYPSAAIDGLDDFHVTYTKGVGAIFNVYYRKRTTATGIWDAIEPVTAEISSQRYQDMKIDDSDNIHVVWSGEGWGLNPGDFNIQYMIKSGGVWGARTPLTDAAAEHRWASLIIDTLGDSHICYGYNYDSLLYRERQSGTWLASETITTTHYQGKMSIDKTGTLFCLWQDGWKIWGGIKEVGSSWSFAQVTVDDDYLDGSVRPMSAVYPIVLGDNINIPDIGFACSLTHDGIVDNSAYLDGIPEVTTDAASSVE